jgi:hypothetical protein
MEYTERGREYIPLIKQRFEVDFVRGKQIETTFKDREAAIQWVKNKRKELW